MNAKGFTLNELLIVLAIIGILAATAVPLYQDYVRRTHIITGLQLVSSAKSAIAYYYAEHGIFPDILTAQNHLAINNSFASSSSAVKQITAEANGIIKIVFNEKVGPNNPEILLQPIANDNILSWNCHLPPTTGVSKKHAPSSCRPNSAPTAS